MLEMVPPVLTAMHPRLLWTQAACPVYILDLVGPANETGR